MKLLLSVFLALSCMSEAAVLETKQAFIYGVDSLSSGYAINGQSWPYWFEKLFLTTNAQFVWSTNISVPGRTMGDAWSKYTNEVQPIITRLKTGGTNVDLVLWGLINDVSQGSNTAWCINVASNYVYASKRDGARRVTLFTITDSQNFPSHYANTVTRYEVNWWIKTNSLVDAVIDTSTRFPMWNAYSGEYVDGVHLNTNSQRQIAGMLWREMQQPPKTSVKPTQSPLFELSQGTIPLATNKPLAGQILFSTSSETATWTYMSNALAWVSVGTGVVTELADDFTIGADANLNTHTTTTGGYAWAAATASGTINDIASTGKATDVSISAAPAMYFVSHTISSSDYTVSADVAYPNTTDANVEAAIGGRLSNTIMGAESCYYVTYIVSLQQAFLVKVVTGAVTILAGPIAATGTSHSLKLVMSGTSISGYSDGNLIGTVTDAAVAGPGLVAIGSGFANFRGGSVGANSATYDNLLVTVP